MPELSEEGGEAFTTGLSEAGRAMLEVKGASSKLSVSENDELCIKNEKLCIINEEFCIKMMNLAERAGGGRGAAACAGGGAGGQGAAGQRAGYVHGVGCKHAQETPS